MKCLRCELLRENYERIQKENRQLRSENERLRNACQAALDWYDWDGSVGGACDPMEELRSAINTEGTKISSGNSEALPPVKPPPEMDNSGPDHPRPHVDAFE